MTKDDYEEYGRKLLNTPRTGKTAMTTAQFLNWLSYSDRPTEFRPLEFKLEKVSIDG